jgi:hypothetical protein
LSGRCQIGASSEHVRQERIETDQLQQSVIHAEDARHLVNMHSLHNAHLMREALPRELIAPIPLYSAEERLEFHKKVAADLQVSGEAKRALTRAKAQETRERNKQAKKKSA